MADIYLYNNEMWKVKYEFTYTGEMNRFTLWPGRYLFICKGAKGGVNNGASFFYQNKGGTSYGIIDLTSPLSAYAVVGGDGQAPTKVDGAYVITPGGYNGGGNGGLSCKPEQYESGFSGGGASDIRLSNDESDVTEELPNPDFPQGGDQLPEEYQVVEYIKTSAKGAYINTGVNLALGMKIEIDFRYINSSGDDWFAGACTNYSSNGIEGGYYGGSLYTGAGFTYSQPNYLEKYTATALINTTQLANTTSKLTVFARNNNGSPGAFTNGYCYGIRIWQDDVMIHNLVPCYRKADNVVGMYDVIDDVFFVNAGSQSFVAGDIVTPTIIKNLGAKTLLSRIMVAGGGGGSTRLPTGDGYNNFSGYGGGINGGYPVQNAESNRYVAPSQSTGYSFGIGQSSPNKNTSSAPNSYGAEGAGGGGGGWYGGYATQVITQVSYSTGNGGGGSGYVLTEDSYKPEGYMHGITPREDLYFSEPLLTSGMADKACVLICEKVDTYLSGDRIICECIGQGTSFPLYGGEYILKCAGGKGSNRYRFNEGAKGGYAEGTLKNPDVVTAYAYVGGSGLFCASPKNAAFIQQTHPTHCFNGGGKPAGYGSFYIGGEAAGGGTDIRIGTDSLLARVIVAGGGGGSGKNDGYGGAGGGTSGETYVNGGYGDNYGPGKQNAAGSGSNVDISGGFGYGGNGANRSSGYGGAGGGGWYGGSGTYPDGGGDDDYGGCGGSGYVLTEDSYKPTGYLLGEDYYLTNTSLVSGGADTLFGTNIPGIIIDVIVANTLPIMAHDSEGYKYYDEENHTWTFLSDTDISVEDFEEYGAKTFIDDTGLRESYDIYVLDETDAVNMMKFNVLPPEGYVKFRYHTEHSISRYNIDSDVDESAVNFQVDVKRRGVAEDAYIYFTFNYDMHDIPTVLTRVYCIQGFTQGSSIEYHERKKKEKTLEHIDLLPVGSATRMPARFKNYIGSFINGSEAITTINSAVVCEHNRCIYSVTLCNNSVVRFAKLNLVNNTSTVIKDIPKSQFGNTFYGDIKVDDNYIYVTSSMNDNSYVLLRTPNSADPTVNIYQVTNSDIYRIQAVGKMEWFDDHTILLMMRKGLAFFNTVSQRFTYKMFPDGKQNDARRDYACGNKKVISLYNDVSNNAWVIDIETGACEGLRETYGIEWSGTYKNNVCFHDGKFYVVQRNRLHVLDEETMTMDYSIPTPFTDMDPKQIVYGNGILYILMQNKPSLYMYDISTQTFYATGIPFTVDNWMSDGWIRMCAFKGYCFIPQIRLYTINFVDRAKYNMGYKYDQFVVLMNEENSEDPDAEFEFDDRFVTFTEDNMTIHPGDINVNMVEVDPVNHIKMISMTKDQYNKIIKTTFSKVEPDDSIEEGEET